MRLRNLVLAVVLSTATQLSLADDMSKTTSKDVSRKVEDAGKAIGNYTIAQRDQAIKSAQAAIADLDAGLRRTERKVDREWDKMDAAARKESRETLNALHRERDEVVEWYGGLKHGSAEGWDEVKGGFVKSYEGLKQSLGKASPSSR